MRAQELLVGGTDTGSTTTEWAIAELMAHPDMMDRTREELDMVVGRDRLMQEFDIPNLPILQAIVSETFRLHTSGPSGNPRIDIVLIYVDIAIAYKSSLFKL